MIQLVGNPDYTKVYISGPITGIANKNIDEFKKYQKRFLDLGFEVVNPHDLHSPEELKEIETLIECKAITEKQAWVRFMKKDLPAMYECDFVAVLKGWEKSDGANLEVYNAHKLFMPVVDAETLIEIF